MSRLVCVELGDFMPGITEIAEELLIGLVQRRIRPMRVFISVRRGLYL